MKKLFVLFGAVVLVVAFTAPAFAAEWSFYGSARMSTFWTDVSKELGPTGDDDLDLGHALQGNSRIGAKVKVSDNLAGRFEYGSGPSLRLLFGEYDFGGFKLLVGQDYAPLYAFLSNQVFGGDTDMLGVGGIYNGRRNMVKATFGGLKVALVNPITTSIAGYTDTDVTLPMIQARYTFKMAGLGLQLVGGYQTYDVVTAADSEDDVSSYQVGLAATYNMGPLYLAANYWMGQNAANLGQAQFGYAPNMFASADATGILDNDAYGFLVVVGFTMSDMIRFEGGYGFASADLDKSVEKDESTSWYIQATINLAKGVFIVPEFGAYNLEDNSAGVDQGDVTYYGLKWQINF